MKKMLLVSLVFLAVVLRLVPHVFAHGFVPPAGIPGLTEGTTANSSGLAAFFNNLYKYLIGLAAALAVIEIIWGGLEISTQDSVSKQSAGKERITQAIFGLVLVLSPVLVFSIINPSILNLSLNLPPLDTKSAQIKTPTFGTGDATTAIADKCSVALGNGTVGCPSQAAAQAFVVSCSNGSGQIFSTNDPKLPYSASCNTLQPFQGHRDYTSVAEIPKGYWCYTVKVISGATASLVYVCQVSKDSCSSLALNNPVSGTIVGSGGCSPY